MRRLFVVLIAVAAMAVFATDSAHAGGGSKGASAQCGGFGP